MPRFATIDGGTNSVLLLVADRQADGRFVAVLERAEITRLGRGVDATLRLSSEGMDETLRVLSGFAAEARGLGAEEIAVSATSAARDAQNGSEFLAAAKARAGVTVEIISGEEEARLSFTAVRSQLQGKVTPGLVVIDIGGGSTELIYGGGDGSIDFRRSFDVGSVRMTERFVKADGLDEATQEALRRVLADAFAPAPVAHVGATVVGVAGTVTTLYAVAHAIDPYDAARVEGGELKLEELRALRRRLWAMSLDERRGLPGLQPKRADVIPAGALILECALERLSVRSCLVSDRGLRWGLLAQRFGVAGR
jgi:exopolyphosphatase/guanosine-5'-triphosphate,3'-diphosphate pyrophosphatase